MKFYPLAHIFYISCPSVIPGVYCFRRGRRLHNSPHFAYSRTREQSNKRSGTRLKTESERLERFARMRLLRHALAISWLILRKKPTVLQSIVKVARYHFLQIKCSAARASGFSRVEGGGGDRKGGEEKQVVPQRLFLSPTPKKFPICHFFVWLQ